MTMQVVIAFLYIHRFSMLLVTSLLQFVYMCRMRRKLKLYVRWYRSQQQAQQVYYQPQYRQW